MTYAWQDALVSMTDANLQCAFLDPSQGRLTGSAASCWAPRPQNYYHAHDYVESYINPRRAPT